MKSRNPHLLKEASAQHSNDQSTFMEDLEDSLLTARD